MVTKKEKVDIFNMMLDNTIMEIGVKLGLDKTLGKRQDVVNHVYRSYKDVRDNPEKFKINSDQHKKICDTVAARSIAPGGRGSKKALTKEERVEVEKKLENMDIKELVLSNRDKLGKLFARKLNMMTDKDLKAMKLTEFTNPFGMLFDKGQIIQGQSTENIAVLSKIEDGLTSKQLLEALLGQRENTITNK